MENDSALIQGGPVGKFHSANCLLILSLVLALNLSCRVIEVRGSEVQGVTDGDASTLSDIPGKGSFPISAYDPGPDLETAMGKELLDIHANIPYFPGISWAIYGDQMFRPAFGPIPWRMRQEPNSIKILFIGQDGTHIAEAAGRPATAGFGGRAQDLAKYFGVSSSAAFINTYAFTIRWQYGAFDAPVITKKSSATPQLNFASLTGNQVWQVSQDRDSPVTKWRNSLISWIIRNNRDSLKLIVLFGGAARDAMGGFVEDHGGHVGTRYTEVDLANIEVPEYTLVGAGSNRQTAVPVDKDGNDLIGKLAGAPPNYKDPATSVLLHDNFRRAFSADPQKSMSTMILTHGGLAGSGIIHPAQLGGYDIDNKMQINGQLTHSLKGLQISSDFVIDHDILVTQLPHPTALSMMTPNVASEAVAKDLQSFKAYVDSGWKIAADLGVTNSFAEGKPYHYSRADMGTEYYDFGAPNSRMVNVSSASRSGANVIVFGTRDHVAFDTNRIKEMTLAKPSDLPPSSEMWIAKPLSPERRANFDPGPGRKYAKIMKEALPRDEAFLKHFEINGDFGHYRGTFKDPQVVIFADPDGEDDLLTSRALTGARGQFLHGLMHDIGVGDRYLVIKTAPYSFDEIDLSDWIMAFSATQLYRDRLYSEVLKDCHPRLIITDGTYAQQELARIAPGLAVPVIALQRQAGKKDAGIAEAASAVRGVAGFEASVVTGQIKDIPRSHLPYYARTWEGTSGDRVITSSDPNYRGKAFALVAPEWAYKQKFRMTPSDENGVSILMNKLNAGRLRHGQEKIPAFLQRIGAGIPAAPQAASAADVDANTPVVAPEIEPDQPL
jgi:hypothetical protein